MIAKEMLYLMAKAIEHKSKSFIFYVELSRNISNKNFRRILIEMILQEQKHFEALNGMISQLLEGNEQSAIQGLLTGNVENKKKPLDLSKTLKEGILVEEKIASNTGNSDRVIENSWSIDTMILNQLIRTKSLPEKTSNKGFENILLTEEKKNIDNEKLGGDRITGKKIPAETRLLPEKRLIEKENIISEEIQSPGTIHERPQKQGENPSRKEGSSLEQRSDNALKGSGILVWNLGKTIKKKL